MATSSFNLRILRWIALLALCGGVLLGSGVPHAHAAKGFRDPISIGMSPDGRTIWVHQMAGWVAVRRDPVTGRLHHLASHAPSETIAGSQSGRRSFAFSGDIRFVYFATYDRPTVIQRVDVSGDLAVELAPIPLPDHVRGDDGSARGLLAHPDGVHLLVEWAGADPAKVDGSTLLYRIRADGGLDLVSEHPTRWPALGAFSRDGSTLHSWYGWRSFPPSGADWPATAHTWSWENPANGMAVLSDGGRLGLTTGNLVRWNAGRWDAVAPLPARLDPGVGGGGSFSPDERFIYALGRRSSGEIDALLTSFRVDEAAGSIGQVQVLYATEECRDPARTCAASAAGEHLSRPQGMVVSPDGRHAYVLNGYSASEHAGINAYRRDPGTGLLQFDWWGDDVSLDRLAPTLKAASASVNQERGNHRLSITAEDDLSGVAQVQVATNLATPSTWFRYWHTLTRPGSNPPDFLRVRDAAQNTSGWRLLARPRLAIDLLQHRAVMRGCGSSAKPCVVARSTSLIARARPTEHARFLAGAKAEFDVERRGSTGWVRASRRQVALRKGVAAAAMTNMTTRGLYRIHISLPEGDRHSASAPVLRYVRIR